MLLDRGTRTGEINAERGVGRSWLRGPSSSLGSVTSGLAVAGIPSTLVLLNHMHTNSPEEH